MDSSIVRRIRNGFGANIYGQVVTVIVQLAGVPILLHAWGAQLYGEWLILSAIPVYLSLTNMGLSQAAANDISAKIARGENTDAAKILQGLAWFLAIAIAIALCCVIFVVFLAAHYRLINLQEISSPVADRIIILLSFEILISIADGLNDAGFRSNGQYAFYTIAFFSTILAQQIAIWLTAIYGYGPLNAAAAFALVRICSFPAITFYLFIRNPNLKTPIKLSNLKKIKHLHMPAIANFLMPVAQALSLQGMIILIGGTLGGIAVASFAAMRLLTRSVMRVGALIAHSVEPEEARAYGVNNMKLLRRLYFSSQTLSIWIALIGSVALYIVGPKFYEVWTQNRLVYDSAAYRLLILSSFSGVFWYGGLHLMKACNLHVRSAVIFLVASAISLIGTFIGLHFNKSLWVAALALSVFDITFALYIVKQTSRFINTSYIRTWKSITSTLSTKTLFAR